MLGWVREVIWLFVVRSPTDGSHAAMVQARKMDTTTAAATSTREVIIRPGQPLIIPAAIPTMGVMSGAMSMAPITTAVESWITANVAIEVARLVITQKETSLAPRRGCS